MEGAIPNVSARCHYGTRRHHCSKVLGWGWSSREEEEREGESRSCCCWWCSRLPNAVFRSPSILTVFLGYLADAVFSSTHQHLFCFQCQSLEMISVCRSLWIVGFNSGKGKWEERCSSGHYSVSAMSFQLHFHLSHSPPTITLSAKKTLGTVAKPPVRVVIAHVMCLLASGCRWFCV